MQSNLHAYNPNPPYSTQVPVVQLQSTHNVHSGYSGHSNSASSSNLHAYNPNPPVTKPVSVAVQSPFTHNTHSGQYSGRKVSQGTTVGHSRGILPGGCISNHNYNNNHYYQNDIRTHWFPFPRVTVLSFNSPIAATASIGTIMSVALLCLGLALESPLLAAVGALGLVIGMVSNLAVSRRQQQVIEATV